MQNITSYSRPEPRPSTIKTTNIANYGASHGEHASQISTIPPEIMMQMKLGPGRLYTLIMDASQNPHKYKDRPDTKLEREESARYDPFLIEFRRKSEREEGVSIPDYFLDIRSRKNDFAKPKPANDNPDKNRKYNSYNSPYSDAYKKTREIIVYGIKNAKDKAKSLYSANNSAVSILKTRLEKYSKKSYEIDFKKDESRKQGLYEKVFNMLARNYNGVKDAVQYLKSLSYAETPQKSSYSDNSEGTSNYFSSSYAPNPANHNELEQKLQDSRESGLEAITNAEFRRAA